MTGCRIILASASLRRDELLNQIALPHEILVTDADEAPSGDVPAGYSPAEWYALYASAAKAGAAEKSVFSESVPDGKVIIISADTVVSPDGVRVFGKPADAADAGEMLRTLSGREHFVIGGITVSDGIRRVSRSVSTTVVMKNLSENDISAYIATGEPFGKAGAYAIQGRGAVLVHSISGDYANVVGISTSALRDILKFDFSLEIL